MIFPAAPEKRPAISRRKAVFFALVALILFFAAVTYLLSRLERRGAIRTDNRDDAAVYVPADLLERKTVAGVDTWFFGGTDQLRGRVLVDKPADVYRIVCVGGSFIMGFPYTKADMLSPGLAGIPQWLQLELAARYPSRRFEVINLGVAGQNSTRVAELVERFQAVRPDLVVVATGNNEGQKAPSAFSRALHQWILYRVMKKTLVAPVADSRRPLFTPQDPDLRMIEETYRGNLRRIVRSCTSRKVPLILATLPINLRFHGFANDPVPNSAAESDDPRLIEGKALISAGEYQKAREKLLQSRDQIFATYYLALSYDLQDRFDKARDLYRAFAQMNPLNRARPSFNEDVRALANTDGVYLVDLEADVESFSVGRIPHFAFFLDYCHLKWWGYQMMARQIAKKLVAAGLIPAGAGEPLPPPSQSDLIAKNHLEALVGLDESADRELFVDVWEKGDGSFPRQMRLDLIADYSRPGVISRPLSPNTPGPSTAE